MPRNKSQNQQLRDERREQILSQALMLFAKRGLAATKITDIADASAISQGLMYHYFSSKEAIFVELISRAFDRLNQACRWLEEQSMPPLEKITFALTELLKLLDQDEHAACYHLLIAQATASDAIPDEAKAIILRENTFPYESISRIMAAGQQEGTIKQYDADQLALIFWTSINGLAIYKAVHGTKYLAPNVEILVGMFQSNHL
ncbi:TetR/AcrR family transcriptional regulator [Anoxynatronum buryatiense]|uniref:Transcriptional regulator, TetR family n=1 Tax=Anoxynatronum buryatiense TaxID=489973 RepID=A0AA46AKM1_9CLOT|nr:TetR/AcrR family transcriptional regulator [Anoxynatronum buryatiense]SMP72173.1 transcriptional regulator, TetR family [Anoxynatronum buryatiense]